MKNKNNIMIVEFDINDEVIAVWTKKEFEKYCKSKPLFSHVYWLEYELNKENGKI